MVAVMTPTREMPTTMSATATRRPVPVTGNVSPYPTVVTVVAAHHSASANVVMCAAPGASRSASSTDRAAMRMRIAAAVTTA